MDDGPSSELSELSELGNQVDADVDSRSSTTDGFDNETFVHAECRGGDEEKLEADDGRLLTIKRMLEMSWRALTTDEEDKNAAIPNNKEIIETFEFGKTTSKAWSNHLQN
jgi:hypothetical protein